MTVMFSTIFKEGKKQSVPNAGSRNGWPFRYVKSQLRYYLSIYLYRFSVYQSLIFSNRLIGKHVSDFYPNHFMLHNPAKQKQSTTLQCVDCDKNLNFNRVFSHSKRPSLRSNDPWRNYKLNYLNR